jgi:hypothetical protein
MSFDTDNPENSGGAPVGLLLHDLLDQSAKGFDACGAFTDRVN